jgi:hypothetical protein
MMDTIADSTRRPWAPLVGPMSSGGAIWLAVAHYFNRPRRREMAFLCRPHRSGSSFAALSAWPAAFGWAWFDHLLTHEIPDRDDPAIRLQRVVAGLPVHHYRAEDLVAEAYAMAFLVESRLQRNVQCSDIGRECQRGAPRRRRARSAHGHQHDAQALHPTVA